ncbi:MAG: LytR/AlgR family response regulator transcription factor [Vicinamibacterales bacterium]
MRALIVDDEPIARRRIRRLLRAIDEIEVAGECGDGRSAIDAIAAERADLVFLDVQMPGLDGFEVVAQLGPERAPAVIFVTAFDRYALRAFDVHAVDYLVKPVAPARFRVAVDRARDRIARGAIQPGMRALVQEIRDRPRYLSRLAVRARGRILMVDVDAIDWIQAADNYVTVHAAGREYLIRDTLATLERQLDPRRFVRIHRSTITALDRITELAPSSHGDFEVQLRDGTRLTLSRSWREHVERALGRPL